MENNYRNIFGILNPQFYNILKVLRARETILFYFQMGCDCDSRR